MDEVKAMTHAGETVGRAMGTGLRTLRRGAVQAGHAGAEVAVKAATAAEQKLAATGTEASRRAAMRMHDLADSLPGAPKSRRRWPWLIALLGVLAAAGTIAALRSRRTEPQLVEEPAEESATTDQQHFTGNGSTPRPRSEQKQFNHKS
jgi:hypothetical protein